MVGSVGHDGGKGEPIASNQTKINDESTLADLGYKQELNRDWSLIHNFGVSFSIISIVTGLTTLFGYGLATGGPGVMTSGWIIVCFFTSFVGMAMAEIVSAHPCAGGPYFWAAVLAPPNYSALFSWVTGWFNFVGQFAVTTGISFGCAGLISTLILVKNPDFEITAGKTVGIYAAILFTHIVINIFGVKALKYFNNSSIICHSLGVTILACTLVGLAPTHQSARDVFAKFNDGTGVGGEDGWSVRASPAYVAVCGILLAQFTITGFDASAHLSEETRDAANSAPKGVLLSIGVSFIFGFFYLLCLLFSIQDFDNTVGSAYGQPVLQIFVDVFGENGAIVGMTFIIVCVWHCGLFSLTSNSRMMFAFARDGGLPPFFHHVDKRFMSPIRTILLAAFLAFVLSLPSLGSSVAYAAATSIATIGLYISYVLPVLAAVIWPTHFKKGPWNLGRFSRIIGIVACLWVAFITVVFCLPAQNPVNSQTLNYTPVAVGIVVVYIFATWFLWARRWFTGPRRQVELEEAGIDVSEQDQDARILAGATKQD